MRTPGSRRDTTWPTIRDAAIELIYEHGYESMNTRQLAELVEMKSGSLYYYFSSKEELLNRLVTEVIQEIIEDLEERLVDVESGLDRLDIFVSGLVEWHVTRYKETHIALMETRSLSGERLEDYRQARDHYDRLLGEIIARCQREGSIVDEPASLIRLSILTMITGITNWFRPSGKASPDELRRFYVEGVRRFVGAPKGEDR